MANRFPEYKPKVQIIQQVFMWHIPIAVFEFESGIRNCKPKSTVNVNWLFVFSKFQ